MPRLHEVLSSIHRLEQAVATAEARLASAPEDIDAAVLAVSSSRLLSKRRSEFNDYLRSYHAEPVSYAVYTGKGEVLPHMREVCSAFTSFETAVLLTAQAKLLDQPQKVRKLEAPIAAAALRYGYLQSNGPKHLALVASTRGETQLEMGFSYDVVNRLTPGDPRRLTTVPDKVLREAAKDVFRIAGVHTSEKIAEFSRKNGPAIIVEINDWCHHHSDSSLDVEATWGSDNQQSLRATSAQLEALWFRIEKLSDDTRYETIEVNGGFYAFNLKTRHFAFQSDDEQVFGGRFPKDMFSERRPAKIPRRYKVIFKKRIKFNEALGSEVVTYEIANLEELKKD